MFRSLDGTDDEIRFAAGTPNTFPFGSAAMIVRRAVTGAWHAIMTPHDASGFASMFNMEIRDSTNVVYASWTGATVESSTAITGTTSPYLIGVSKATGNSAVRFHIFNYATRVWSHENGVSDGNDTGVISTWRIGEWEDVDDLNGSVAIAAVWDSRVLTDEEFENLAHGYFRWLLSRPTRLWLFDQSLTTQNVPCMAGSGSNQSVLNGTAVDGRTVPQWIGR